MPSLVSGEACRVEIDGKWVAATVVKAMAKTMTVRTAGVTLTVPHARTQKLKRLAPRRPSSGREVLPVKTAAPRPARASIPNIVVKAVAFTRPGTIGDYTFHLSPEQQRLPEYGRALHIYNENMYQQTNKHDNYAGGGNACARPHRPSGKAIGMPTGANGGFAALDEDTGFGCTAKEAIDRATDEIVEQVCSSPDRYDTVYYCKNHNDPNELIGMGIFHVDLAVRSYITDKIRKLPRVVRDVAYANRRKQRLGA